jgi:hypothetical protein
MKLSPQIARPPKALLAGLVVVALASLAIGWTAGTASASSGPHAAAATTAATMKESAAGILGAPGAATVSSGTTISSGTSASIAYPMPGYNSLGVAPEGTIVAQGTGTADMKADGSDKSAALGKATDSALADAHLQALATATSVGVQLQAVYSVSVVTNTGFTYSTPGCLIAPLLPGLDGGATGSTGSVPVSSPELCKVQQSTPTSAQLVVTLIVAYKYA